MVAFIDDNRDEFGVEPICQLLPIARRPCRSAVRPHQPDRLWVTDITEHPTREGEVYCAVVLDVFSRRVVGWAIDSSPTSALVTNALAWRSTVGVPNQGPTVIHSDQGTQTRFTS